MSVYHDLNNIYSVIPVKKKGFDTKGILGALGHFNISIGGIITLNHVFSFLMNFVCK
jgi:hypothetical protein